MLTNVNQLLLITAYQLSVKTADNIAELSAFC